jgi:large subunit ribosomal protein L29
MKPAEIREFTDEELALRVEECRRETLNLRLQAQTGQLENTARFRDIRRDLARLETERTARAKRSN